ncbi:MAG: hypothetical protein HY513_04400 [Candidatus Aenigmarchaeota archaeon]|nr:hypothetical protein [Candidatus Aenigmarchaeota archaeon]
MENEELIRQFADNCLSNGLGQIRVNKYRYILPKLAKMLEVDFDKATKPDIENLVRKIEMSDYADWTKSDALLHN